MEPKKYQYIDCLRGLAILLVLLLHSGTIIGVPYFNETGKLFIENGKFGVQLFFMVSAFTLMLSHKSREDESHPIKKFFIRRFFRIAPLYWMALLYYTLSKVIGFRFFLTGHFANPIDWGKFLSNLFFVHGFNINWINSYVPGGWSIADEVMFYALLPLFFIFIKDINVCIRFLIGSLFICMVLDYFVHDMVIELVPFPYFYFPAQLPVFLLGILAYFIVIDKTASVSTSTVLLTGFTVLICCYFSPPYHFVYSLFFLALIIAVSRKQFSILVNPVMAYIGKISYSIYITHFAILQILGVFKVFNLVEETSIWTTWINLILRMVITTGLSVIVSHFTYHFIERKFELVGKAFIKRAFK